MAEVEAKLAALGITLPQPPPPVANYVRAVRTGNLVFLAGHGPTTPFKPGKVPRDLTVEEAYAAARGTAVNLLASLKAEIGDLDRVSRIVKVLGMVNCTEEFGDMPRVINGCSDLLVELFGERGKHARSAVGMQQLPGTAAGNLPVEIEMIVEVSDG
ncbi:MAG: RidA family protein [Dehalococcoidia bacterium]